AGLLADHANEPGKIFFAGWQTRADVAESFATQDCLVFPTLLECGGAVVLEAMAMELPVIASGWGGPSDYIDSTTGVLVSEQSPAQFVAKLASAMVRLASDPALRERMGRAGRLKIEQQYTWSSKIDRMLEYYRAATARAPVRAPPSRVASRTVSGSAMCVWDADKGELG
ncbi:MAG: glycosyltransferase, partial [Proteobacteria bacterium]